MRDRSRMVSASCTRSDSVVPPLRCEADRCFAAAAAAAAEAVAREEDDALRCRDCCNATAAAAAAGEEEEEGEVRWASSLSTPESAGAEAGPAMSLTGGDGVDGAGASRGTLTAGVVRLVLRFRAASNLALDSSSMAGPGFISAAGLPLASVLLPASRPSTDRNSSNESCPSELASSDLHRISGSDVNPRAMSR